MVLKPEHQMYNLYIRGCETASVIIRLVMKFIYRNEEEPMLDTLKRVFGFMSFLPDQETIIRNILNKKDVFAVLPTGGGKSLCYQLPSKILPGTTVVISPLISLMKDQVDAAQENGISAAYLNSSLNPSEKSEVYRNLKSGDLELLYIAPERFVMNHFVEELKSVQIRFSQ